jgi:hypothetical protein
MADTPQTEAELLKLCDEILSGHYTRSHYLAARTIASALRTRLTAPAAAEVAEIEKRHEYRETLINFDGWSHKLDAAHRDVGALLSALRSHTERPGVTRDEVVSCIRKAAVDALFNGAGKIINPEVFDQAADAVLALLAKG